MQEQLQCLTVYSYSYYPNPTMSAVSDAPQPAAPVPTPLDLHTAAATLTVLKIQTAAQHKPWPLDAYVQLAAWTSPGAAYGTSVPFRDTAASCIGLAMAAPSARNGQATWLLSVGHAVLAKSA